MPRDSTTVAPRSRSPTPRHAPTTRTPQPSVRAPIAYAYWETWPMWQSPRRARVDRFPVEIEEAWQLHNASNLTFMTRRVHNEYRQGYIQNWAETPLWFNLTMIWHASHMPQEDGAAVLVVESVFNGHRFHRRRDVEVYFVKHVVDLNTREWWTPFYREGHVYYATPVFPPA